jgi:hypothetical protein
MQPSQSGESRWTAQTVSMSVEILDRMERAVAKVRERLLRATAALNQIGVPYAVVGGNAVASWVATVDEGAVRNSPDIELLIDRDDMPVITSTLEQTGFVRDKRNGIVLFRDGPTGSLRQAISLFSSGCAKADINAIKNSDGLAVLNLEALVGMLLVGKRNQDCMHLRDLIDAGLVDASWLARFSQELAARLQAILDTPEG